MRTLIQTTDRSLVESLRVALEDAGIEAQVFDHAATSLPFIPVTVAIVHDEDVAAATEILRSQQQSARSSSTRPVVRRSTGVLLLLLAVVTVMCLCL